MIEAQFTEGGIELILNTVNIHPSTAYMNKNGNTLFQRVADVEKQGNERDLMESLRGFIRPSAAPWLTPEERCQVRAPRYGKRRATSRARLPLLDSSNPTRAIHNDDDAYHSHGVDIPDTDFRYNTRSVESTLRLGTTNGEASPEDGSSITSMFDSLPKIPSTLPSTPSRLVDITYAKDLARSDVPVMAQQSNFPIQSKRTTAQMEQVIADSTMAHDEDEAVYVGHIVETGHVQKLRGGEADWDKLSPRPRRKRQTWAEDTE
ncbi:hypothetical protein PSPO01_01502 [Paraphaeosphaeria sporulosa]